MAGTDDILQRLQALGIDPAGVSALTGGGGALDTQPPDQGSSGDQGNMIMQLLASGGQQPPTSRGAAILHNLYASPIGASPLGGPLLSIIMGAMGENVPPMQRTAYGTGVPVEGGQLKQLMDVLSKLQTMKASEVGIGLTKAKTAKTEQDIQQAPIELGLKQQNQASLEQYRQGLTNRGNLQLGIAGEHLRLAQENLNLNKQKAAIAEEYTQAKLNELQGKDPGFKQAVEAIRTMKPGDRDESIKALFKAYFPEQQQDTGMWESFKNWFVGTSIKPKFEAKNPPRNNLQVPTEVAPPTAPNPQASDALGNIINRYANSPVR